MSRFLHTALYCTAAPDAGPRSQANCHPASEGKPCVHGTDFHGASGGRGTDMWEARSTYHQTREPRRNPLKECVARKYGKLNLPPGTAAAQDRREMGSQQLQGSMFPVFKESKCLEGGRRNKRSELAANRKGQGGKVQP